MRPPLERPPLELPVGPTAAPPLVAEPDEVVCADGLVVAPWVVDVTVRILVLVPGLEGVTNVVPSPGLDSTGGGGAEVAAGGVVGIRDVVGGVDVGGGGGADEGVVGVVGGGALVVGGSDGVEGVGGVDGVVGVVGTAATDDVGGVTGSLVIGVDAGGGGMLEGVLTSTLGELDGTGAATLEATGTGWPVLMLVDIETTQTRP